MFNLIVAMTSEGTIGHDNQMLWQIPDELQQFKRLTLHKPIIMGYNTFLSIGKALPYRDNYVLTSKRKLPFQGATICKSIDHFIVTILADNVFVIGGVQVYEQFLERNLINTAYVSIVNSKIIGNKKFPLHYLDNWHKELYSQHSEFVTYIYRK